MVFDEFCWCFIIGFGVVFLFLIICFGLYVGMFKFIFFESSVFDVEGFVVLGLDYGGFFFKELSIWGGLF